MAFTYVTSAHNRYGKQEPVANGTTIVKGQVLQWDLTTGNVVPSDNVSTFTETEFIACAPFPNPTDISAPANAVQVWKIDSNNQYIADTVNASNVAHNGQRMILDATGLLANNTGTDSTVGVFRQTGVFGVPANNQIIGEFVSK
jgi:hypothetical protein